MDQKQGAGAGLARYLLGAFHIGMGRSIDKNRIKGAAAYIGGKTKEAACDLTGDFKIQSDGKMDQGEGKVQNAISGIKDAITGKL